MPEESKKPNKFINTLAGIGGAAAGAVGAGRLIRPLVARKSMAKASVPVMHLGVGLGAATGAVVGYKGSEAHQNKAIKSQQIPTVKNNYVEKVAARIEFLEEIADLEHQQWVSWAKALLKKEPGISKERQERWKKLFVPYQELTEGSKEQDRVYARKVLKILGNKH